MGAYRELPPPPAIAPFVRCLWIHEVGEADRAFEVLPDGCIDIVVLDGHAFVAGPDPRPVPAALTPGQTIAGLRFHPGVAPALLGPPASELRDRRVDLDALWGAAGRELGERAEGHPDAIAAAVARRVGDVRPDRAIAAAVAQLERRPATSVATLADHLALSERQLRRRFAAAVGYGPKTFARVVRFQRMVEGLAAGEPLARLAVTAGFADQAHMTHEAVALGGRPPAALRGRFAQDVAQAA